jgi:hypothetical protein
MRFYLVLVVVLTGTYVLVWIFSVFDTFLFVLGPGRPFQLIERIQGITEALLALILNLGHLDILIQLYLPNLANGGRLPLPILKQPEHLYPGPFPLSNFAIMSRIYLFSNIYNMKMKIHLPGPTP